MQAASIGRSAILFPVSTASSICIAICLASLTVSQSDIHHRDESISEQARIALPVCVGSLTRDRMDAA
jgi:hypothetical protein